MKKLVILTIAALLSITSISRANASSPWDYPLMKRVWDPTVYQLYLSCSATELVIESALTSPGIQDGHVWRMTIPTRCYCYCYIPNPFPHWGYQWVTNLYTIDFQPCCLTATETIPLYHQEQYINTTGSLGYGHLRDDQFYVSSLVSM